ncbi:hypothetical protein Tco_0104474 [Tanacetum coccineum]
MDHGESNEVSSSSMMEYDEDKDNDHEMHEILRDLFLTVSMERSMGEQEQERETKREREREPEHDFNCENQNDKKNFDDLVKDVDQKFLQEELLPHGNILPKKHNEVKIIMNKLGLGSTKGEGSTKEESNEHFALVSLKTKASKFMSSKTTHLMKWHHLERVKDGKLRHPADALLWKHFDEKHPEFASDHRNVHLALTRVKRVVGVIDTFDASMNRNFEMKAAVISIISDFPGYANLSSSRKDTQSFDGHQELRQPPILAYGDDILDQLKGVDFLSENVEKSPWKKKSIFFTLPYWKNLLLCHNLDVMHIEKNMLSQI